ncbi:MAG: exodeoxyribonuclease VII small subunit [Clostridia bacterium]|nr:exodeoxyribonuclease VII small subunit [Clostridia bacterium]MBQ1965998.1 exodeoxyribonuclease VII small subunit [Clostridia bacterium]MBQ5743064.1 exodeoxyribonuclease VII small subunit [Clostridia bacterium]
MISRLEEIVQSLESGELSLDETMKVYKEALTLSEKCSKTLEKFRGEITLVRGGEEVPLTNDDLR